MSESNSVNFRVHLIFSVLFFKIETIVIILTQRKQAVYVVVRFMREEQKPFPNPLYKLIINFFHPIYKDSCFFGLLLTRPSNHNDEKWVRKLIKKKQLFFFFDRTRQIAGNSPSLSRWTRNLVCYV